MVFQHYVKMPFQDKPFHVKNMQKTPTGRTIGNRFLFSSGRLITSKSEAPLEYESGLEKSFLSLLIFDEAIKSIKTQPFTIKWHNGDQPKRYTPDVLIEMTSLENKGKTIRNFVFEVKPRKILSAEWALFLPRFRAAVGSCKKHSCLFKLVTDEYIDTPYLTNVNFLLQYDQSRFSISDLDIVTEIESQINFILIHQPLSINELVQSLSPDKTMQQQFLPYIWMLVRHGKLNAELTTPLTMKTIVWNGEPPFDYNFEQSPIRRRLRSRIITP